MKRTYGVSSLDSHALGLSEFYQLMSESKEAIAAYTRDNKLEPIYVTKSKEMTDLLEAYQAGLHQSRASQLVSKLVEHDRQRDEAIMTLTSLVKAFSRVKVPATKEAYETLAGLLKNYKGLVNSTYEKETEGINHLLQELKKESYQSALATLHLESHVDSLASAQKIFEKTYKERLNELKGKTASQTKQVRIKLQENYDFLLDFTAIHAYAFPDKKHYSDLRDQLNAIRGHYKKRKASKKTEKEAEEA